MNNYYNSDREFVLILPDQITSPKTHNAQPQIHGKSLKELKGRLVTQMFIFFNVSTTLLLKKLKIRKELKLFSC